MLAIGRERGARRTSHVLQRRKAPPDACPPAAVRRLSPTCSPTRSTQTPHTAGAKPSDSWQKTMRPTDAVGCVFEPDDRVRPAVSGASAVPQQQKRC